MFAREMGLLPRLAIYAALSLALMGLDARFDTLALLRTGTAAVVHPVQAWLARPFQFLAEAGGFFTVHGELLRHNIAQEAEIRRLASASLTQGALEAENLRLRALLGLPPRPGIRGLAVEVVRAQPDPFSRKLILNKGLAHGVQIGRPVVDPEGLVGQITRVFPHSSELTLITDREQSVPLQSLRTGLRLVASGRGSDNLLEVGFLDAHADLKAGDTLVTSGLDGIYPPGLPVARVTQLEPPRNTPFARAVCVPLAHPGEHRHLVILQAAP